MGRLSVASYFCAINLSSIFSYEFSLYLYVYIGIPVSVFPTKPVFWCFFGAFEHLPILNLQLPGIEGAAKTTAASIFYRQIIIVVIVYIDVPVF